MLDAMEEIWNNGIGDKFPNLKLGHFRNYMRDLPNYKTEGPIELCHDVMCNPHYWNGRAGGSGTKTANCEEGICASIDSCDVDETDLAKRLAAREAEWTGASPSSGHFARAVLEKRAGPSPYSPVLTSPDGCEQITVTITLRAYYGFSDLDPDDPIMDEVVDFGSRGDCTNTRIVHLSLPNGGIFNIEHLFDGNLMGRFMSDAASGRLRSGAVARTGPVSISFFRQARTMPLLPGAPPLPGGADHPRLYDRVMDCLGSYTNQATFVGAHADINAVKPNAPDFFAWLVLHTRDFVQNGINRMRRYWGAVTNDIAEQVLEILRSLESQLEELEINTDEFD
ncbi:hypothetical protein DL771_008022 [Monosporascus sp. 5C6A]|nr:hypothetical protein DL771_008022 [Monosporascus sp. 5C6A]